MRKQALPVAMITVLTLVVWLFAEAESLTQVQTTARIRFANLGEPAELLARAENFDDPVSITLRGSRGAIARARALLDSTVVLRPGDTGVPDVDGLHVVSIRQALEAYDPLVRTGVVIESVRPRTVDVSVDEVIEVDLPILADLTGIITQGDVVITPPRARVRLPKRLMTQTDAKSLTATIDPTTIDDSSAGPRTVTVDLKLADTLEGADGVELVTERCTVAFTLRSTIEPRTFSAVPVQVLLTPQSARSWEIEINDQQQLIPVTLRGPSERLDQIGASGARLIAVLALSDIELSRGLTEKPVRLVLLRDDVPTSLPEGITTAEDLPTVRFTSRRIEEEVQE